MLRSNPIVLFIACVWVVLSAALFPACKGGVLGHCFSDGDCGSDSECKDGTCKPSQTASSSGSSGQAGKPCQDDPDCAPDGYCHPLAKICMSLHECDTPEDCQPGQECRDFNNDSYRDCGWPGCTSDEECAQELTDCPAGTKPRCQDRACVCRSPCGGDCGANRVCCGMAAEVCAGATACCLDQPDPCVREDPCPTGFSRAGNAAEWNVDQCAYTSADCQCRELPPLPMGGIGSPSAIGLDGNGVLHAVAYNRTYGDLMLGVAQNGGAMQWSFMDGVPATGTVTGNLNGPRGGISDPGQDVGRYLDLAVTSTGVMHIVYQDSTAGTLIYSRIQDGTTTRFTLDGTGETGVYPSLALDPASGAPRVAYLTRRDETGGTPFGRLRMAAATTATPATATDFVFHTLKQVDLMTVPCQGGCPTGTRCAAVEPPTLPVCVAETECDCPMGEFCTADGCKEVHPASDYRNVPQGPGVWSDLTIRPNGTPVVAVYDSFGTDLVVYTPSASVVTPNAQFTSVVVDGTDVDAGQWPALGLDGGGTLHVVYVNATTRALMHVTLNASMQVGTKEVVDDAKRVYHNATDIHHLADPAFVVAADGTLTIAYQDGNTSELLLTVGKNAPFNRERLAGGKTGSAYDGLYGFSNDMAARAGSSPVISTAKHVPDVTPPVTELVLFNWGL